MPPDPTTLQARMPNLLTVGRLLLAAAFIALLEFGLPDRWGALRGYDVVPDLPPAAEGRPAVLLIAAGLFVVAAVTDALDGYLARKWNAISKFGRVMDPFADKVLVLGAFVMLAGPSFQGVLFVSTAEHPVWRQQAWLPIQVSGVAPWMAILIVARELLVTSVRGFFESRGVDFSADAAGKAKMILQSLVIPLALVLLAVADVSPGSPARWAIDLGVWLTVAATVLSCLPYVVKGVRSGRGLIHEP